MVVVRAKEIIDVKLSVQDLMCREHLIHLVVVFVKCEVDCHVFFIPPLKQVFGSHGDFFPFSDMAWS